MEIRRVQMTGGSSFVITLPKEWIESLSIKKNDPLGVLAQSDGTLIITKNISGDQVHRVKQLDVDSSTDPESFLRMLIGIYIAGYNAIQITSKDRLPSSIRIKLREFSNMVIGPEFIEETDHSILLKDLLNPMEMPFENSLKRMFVIAKGMHYDAIEALIQTNRDLAMDVIERDADVDRLFWLIARQTNMIMHNVHLSRKMETSVAQMLPYFQIARIIERVGDHGVRLAKNALKISRDELGDAIIDHIHTASKEAIQIFERSIEAFFAHDLKRANRTIESIHGFEDNYTRINEELLDLKTTLAVPIRNISDSIRRAGEYSVDIAEIVINNEMMLEDKV